MDKKLGLQWHSMQIGFCLVRTNPDAEKPQQGISFLLIDMKTPGVTVRPIKLMDGSHEVNETWFDNVKVPVEKLISQKIWVGRMQNFY